MIEMESFDSEDENQSKTNDEQHRNDSSETSSEEEVVPGDEVQSVLITNKMESIHSVSVAAPLPRRKRFIPKYEIPGVHKVELGEETQLQIEMVIGTHVYAQFPWKTVSKAKLIENIELGGENSEFYFIKDEIRKYPEEELLMGYIVDESKDADEFYICITVEAKEHCKQQSDKFIRRQEKKLYKSIHKKPKPWVSLGSEKEIIPTEPLETRALMEVEVKAKYPTLYDPEKFTVRDANAVRDGYIELTPYRQKFSYVTKRRIDSVVQASPSKTDIEVQTVLRYPQNMWTQTITDKLGNAAADLLGGGDFEEKRTASVRKISSDIYKKKEKESSSESDTSEEGSENELKEEDAGIINYKAAIMRTRRPSYIKKINKFVLERNAEIDDIVELNSVMDIYRNDYPVLKAVQVTEIYKSMVFEEYICFTDVRAKDKCISTAVFHPMWSGIVAICYSDGSSKIMTTVSTVSDPVQRAVYGINPVLIWSHVDSLLPKLFLNSPREVKSLAFCPYDENILVGGCINGQIVIWDLTHKLENVEKLEDLSETRERYRIAMLHHMEWQKDVHDKTVVQPTAISNLMTSHYGAVTSIHWFSPKYTITSTGKPEKLKEGKNSLVFFTGSEDGNILIWNLSVENYTLYEGKKIKKSKRVTKRPSALMVDVSPYKILDRNLQPSYKIILGVAGQPQIFPLLSFGMNKPILKYVFNPLIKGTGRKYFTCEIPKEDNEENDLSRTIYCGSNHGDMMKVMWEGHEFNTGEVVNSEYCDIEYNCTIHDGVVTRVEKNPFLNSVCATIGGKIFAIWSDKLKNKPLLWKKRHCRLTDCKWSLYKPSLLFISTSGGDLETWDLLLRSDQPIAVQTLSGSMLTGVSVHELPLNKNIIGVSDVNGSFRMFLVPPIFMLQSPLYITRMDKMIQRELTVMLSFNKWQGNWIKNNADKVLEIKRKEAAAIVQKEEEKKRLREEEERRLEQEAEARKIARAMVIGPEERWQKIVQKLIERTIAVKKRINRAELIEQEKPLRELEAQRLEKERRMLEIMKNQKSIFDNTVAILFPEAIKKPELVKKSLLSETKETMKQRYLKEYEEDKFFYLKTVTSNPYQVQFSWDATLAEGKERRQALNSYEMYINLHKSRLEDSSFKPSESKENKSDEDDEDLTVDDAQEADEIEVLD